MMTSFSSTDMRELLKNLPFFSHRDNGESRNGMPSHHVGDGDHCSPFASLKVTNLLNEVVLLLEAL